MKLSLTLVSILAVLAAGCTRPVVKETVVERPVVVERPAAAVGATSGSCIYAAQAYSHGAISCQERSQYRCDNGVWNRTLSAC